MLTLFKIRMTYMKRNFCSSIGTYIIFPLIFVFYGPFIEYIIKKEQRKLSNISNNLKLLNDSVPNSQITYLVKYNLFEEQLNLSGIENLAIITNKNSIGEEMKNILKNVTDLGNITLFNTTKEFEDEINSEKYKNQTPYSLLFDIEKNDKEYEFKFKLENITTTSLKSSSNEYNIDSRTNVKNKAKRKVEQFEKIHRIFTYFFRKLKNNIMKKISIQSIQFVNGEEIFQPEIDFLNLDFDIKYISIFFGSNIFQMTISSIILWMVKEKEEHLEEFLYRQGITQKQNILSWGILYGITSILPAIGAIYYYSTELLSNINLFLIIIIMLLFIICTFFFIILVQSFLYTVKTTNSFIKVFSLIMMVFSFTIFMPSFSKILKFFTMLFPNVSFIMTFLNLYKMNNFPTFDSKLLIMSSEGDFSFIFCVIYYVLLTILYFFVVIFVLKYQKSGLDFITFIKSPIYGKERKIVKTNKLIPKEEINNLGTENSETPIINIEENIRFLSNHENLTETEIKNKDNNNYLKINNVTRQYDDLKAVDNFSAELFPNEIFCLLGHNGAGKTTLIKMISGLEDPDNGDIFLGLTSLVTNKNYLFQNLGICNQEDILFDYLTVREHLNFFYQIKNNNQSNVNQVRDFIQNIQLDEKKDDLCSTLSGGQKRKLCVALALIGNSKLVLLDEPTSGIDVIARRELWKFLKMNKNDKIIILTTHSLEEAEYLGDRIGIMNEGHFICSGTSSYLKNKYPSGFNLNLIINNKIFNQIKKNELMEELKKIDNSALIKIFSNAILSINFNSIKQNAIGDLFDYLDGIKESFGIEQYTISTTSLEDVFINLNTNEMSNKLFLENNEDNNNILNVPDLKSIEDFNIPFFTQLKANIIRNINTLWRDKLTFIFEVISSIGLLFIFSIGLHSMITENTSYINVEELLTMNKIYISTKNADLIKNSSYYKKFENKMNIEWLNQTDFIDIFEFGNYMYKISKLKNEKSAIYIKEDENEIKIMNLYQSVSPDFYQATTNMLINILIEKYNNYIINSGKSYSFIPLGSKSTFIDKFKIAYVEFIIYILIYQSLFTIGSYMINTPLKERITNTKHLLYLSGSDMLSYWIGLFVVDILKVLIFEIILLPILLIQNIRYLYVLIVIFVCLIAFIFFVYIFTFFVNKEEEGVKYFILFGNLLSVILLYFSIIRILLYYVLKGLTNDLLNIILNGKYIFSECDLLPVSSIMFLMMRYFITMLLTEGNEIFLKLTLKYLLVYILQSIFYGCLLILIETGIFVKILNSILVKFSYSKMVDNPVVTNTNTLIEENTMRENLIFNESSEEIKNKNLKEQIEKANNVSMTTRIINLTKSFWVCCGNNIRAVNKLNFGLEENEKFGLLGFNGSGKTTTFKSITQEILYDSGEIYLFGKELNSNFKSMRKLIGYCPQENAIFDFLSVEETLNYYITLKGIKISKKEIFEKFGLEKYLNTICKNLSGGNKRKLTFAISILNSPKILLLDEPSTGVDPENRRIMWKNIMNLGLNNNKFNMILSTHSMEEAEILCDTVSWLKNGNFECVGNPERLKIEFSAGYNFHIKINKNENNDSDNINNNISHDIKGIVKGWDNVNEKIKNDYNYLGNLYIVLNAIKENCDMIEFYECFQDDSFDFIIKVDHMKQGKLFTQILTLKDKYNYVEEISIKMQSLENILTNL